MIKDVDTCFNYCGGPWAYFSSNEQKWIHLILEMSKSDPENVKIISTPEDNHGCIYCKIHPSYLKIAPKRKRVMTQEQMEVARERGRQLAEQRKQMLSK